MKMERSKEFFAFCMILMLMIPAAAIGGAVPDTGQTVCYDDQGNALKSCPSECGNKDKDGKSIQCARTYYAEDGKTVQKYYNSEGKEVTYVWTKRCFDAAGNEVTCPTRDCYDKATAGAKIDCPQKCYNKAPASGGTEIPCPGSAEKGKNEANDFYGQDGNYTINTRSYTKLAYGGNAAAATATDWPMVKDSRTNLIWEVKQAGTSDPSQPNRGTNKYVFSTIQTDFIAKLNANGFGSYKDWRLPTAGELAGIIDSGKSAPAINVDSKTGYFLNMQSGTYWTSTESGTQAYAVDFSDGSLKLADKTVGGEAAENYAIAVRSVK